MEDVLETRDRDDPWTKERKTHRITKHICTSETHHSRLVRRPPSINPTHSLFLPVFPLHSPEPLPEACAHKDKTLERSSCGATGTSLSFTPVMTHWSLIRTQQRHHFLPEHWLQGISCRCPTYRKHFCLNGINIKQNWTKVKVVTFLTDTGSWTGTGAPGGGGGNDRALWLLLSRTKCWVDDVTFVLSG